MDAMRAQSSGESSDVSSAKTRRENFRGFLTGGSVAFWPRTRGTRLRAQLDTITKLM